MWVASLISKHKDCMSNENEESLELREKPAPLLSPNYTITALVVPRVETVLDDALSVIHLQLKRTGARMANSEAELSSEETRNLCAIVDAISKVSREKRQRESEEADELNLMSDEEVEAELAGMEEE